jgi:hypothetical protein
MSRRKAPVKVKTAESAQQSANVHADVAVMLQERLIELETALEGYVQASSRFGEWEFTRPGLERIIRLSRLMFLQNPLISRAVQVCRLYVWALGFNVSSKDDAVQKVIDQFFGDQRNKASITSRSALGKLEEAQMITGNIFYAHFVNSESGKLRIKVIDFDEITDVITNPEDITDPWYYRRTYTDDAGINQVRFYRDINFDEGEGFVIPKSIQLKLKEGDVVPNVFIRHKKTGGLIHMRFGLPEIYSGLNWAGAVKSFLEDWSTIMRAYARIAMQLSGPSSSRKQQLAAKSKLEVGTFGSLGNTASAGGFAIMGGGQELKSVKTAGSTTSASEAYELKMMTAAGAGIPGHFFGDADVGNYATSSTLDRPTELKFKDRQGFWSETILEWLEQACIASANAPNGVLHDAGYTVEYELDPAENRMQAYLVDPDGERADLCNLITVAFPDILERNATERVRAIIGALTLNGDLPTDLIPDRVLATRFLLEATGMLTPDQIEDALKKMYPDPAAVKPIQPPQDIQMQQIKANSKTDGGSGGGNNANN